MSLEIKTEGWWGGNSEWNTYNCLNCGEDLHIMSDQPTPEVCPFCGEAAEVVEDA